VLAHQLRHRALDLLLQGLRRGRHATGIPQRQHQLNRGSERLPTYESPSEYEYEGCTYSSGQLLDLLASGVLVYSYRTDYTGDCEYTTPYVSTYSGTWEMLSGALYSIRVDESYDYNCSLEGNDLNCVQEGEGVVKGFRRL